jgi:DNA polymerase-4
VGITNLAPAQSADPASLIDPTADKRVAAERAMDKIRAKFGGEAVGVGRSFHNERPTKNSHKK